MKFPAIKKVVVIGTDLAYQCDKDGVTEILDKSLEYESRMEHIIYIMKGDSVFIELINVPLLIEHFE